MMLSQFHSTASNQISFTNWSKVETIGSVNDADYIHILVKLNLPAVETVRLRSPSPTEKQQEIYTYCV